MNSLNALIFSYSCLIIIIIIFLFYDRYPTLNTEQLYKAITT